MLPNRKSRYFSDVHLMLAGVPVVQQACRDDEGVVLVAALAVVPAAVVADLGLPPGESDRPLAACGGSAETLSSAGLLHRSITTWTLTSLRLLLKLSFIVNGRMEAIAFKKKKKIKLRAKVVQVSCC